MWEPANFSFLIYIFFSFRHPSLTLPTNLKIMWLSWVSEENEHATMGVGGGEVLGFN